MTITDFNGLFLDYFLEYAGAYKNLFIEHENSNNILRNESLDDLINFTSTLFTKYFSIVTNVLSVSNLFIL